MDAVTASPYALVMRNYTLPFELYGYQQETVNNLAPLAKAGHYLAVGVGKTATSTVSALYKKLVGEVDQIIVLMPPILLAGWHRWLCSISGVSSMIYAGTPAQRSKMKFDCDFTLMSYDIYKRDFDRIAASFDHGRLCIICDEATAIKNIESKNYQRVLDIVEGFGHLMLLTGTPLSKILDGYAYVKLIAPTVYRTFTQYQNIHIKEYDYWGIPTEYQNLDMLERNLRVNSVRLLKEDVLDQLPDIQYDPIIYNLEPKHLKLYHKLAEEHLLEFEDGSKIDATQTTRLWHALQQIVMNYDYFSDNPENVSAGFQLVDQIMDELDEREEGTGRPGGKLIVFTNYKLTSRQVSAYTKDKYGSVSVFGDISAGNQQKNIDRFMNDPTCRLLVAQVQSAGYGLNLQDCCSDILFLEAPLSPIQFEQAVGRVYRNGQKRKVHVRVAMAKGTIQVHLNNLLMKKDALVNKVVRNFQDIRTALFGT